MQFDILTLFPDLIYNYCDESILGRAQAKDLVSVRAHNFREFATNKWGHVDDKPYGGGPGMILQVEPIYQCLKKIKKARKSKIVIMDPAGKKFDQRMAEKFTKLDQLILIAGRYEGFDARISKLVDERVSVGDYVLAGGELPALTIVEVVSRLIPGVLGNPESLNEETHSVKTVKHENSKIDKKIKSINYKLKIAGEYPQYTRPENFMGLKVPKMLLSGDHTKIAEWRKKKSK